MSEVHWHQLPLHPDLERELETILAVENERQPQPITLDAFLLSVICNFVFLKRQETETTAWQRQKQKEYVSQNVTWMNSGLEAMKVKK